MYKTIKSQPEVGIVCTAYSHSLHISSISLPTERAPPLSNSLHAIYLPPLFCFMYFVLILFTHVSILCILYSCILVNCLCSYFINCMSGIENI